MRQPAPRSRQRRRVAIDAVMALVILVLMVQMWLLTATLESYLAGHHRVAVPALLSSLVLFGVCGLLYRLVLRLDQVPDATKPDDPLIGGPGPWRVGGAARPTGATPAEVRRSDA